MALADNLVIDKYPIDNEVIYGCKHAGKYIVGVGCILYDPVMDVVMLGNEYNKQQRILKLNTELSEIFGYFEDFGGKVEYKHVDMHLFDIALGELFEETAMLFNLHYDDMATCIDKEWYKLIPVPETNDLKQYMCIIIPFNLTDFLRIREKFQENIKAITNSTITCQKQFYEISDVRFFQVDKLKIMPSLPKIKGFYGTPDDVYMCEELCGQHFYISSRIKPVFDEVAKELPFGSLKDHRNAIYDDGELHNLNGIQHFVSNKYRTEAKDKLKPVQLYLQKYFVSRLDSTSPGAKIAIGGDIPLMYYNEILGKKELDSPRLVIYTNNPCFALFNNVSMKYNTDNTNLYLTKWFTALEERMEEPIVINIGDDDKAAAVAAEFDVATKKVNGLEAAKETPIEVDPVKNQLELSSTKKYARGTFFQLNDRIYFSYLHGSKYHRVFIGLVRLLDDSIITYDNIIYKQTLAVEVCSSMHIQYMNELVEEKEAKEESLTIINYFHDDEIARIRQWKNPTAYQRFTTYCNPNKLHIDFTLTNANNIHLKGKYALFNEVVKLCCEKAIRFDGTSIKPTKDAKTLHKRVTDLFSAIISNLKPPIRTLFRASMPFEFDCDIDISGQTMDSSIFTLNNTSKFVYNGIMWASEPPTDKSIPDFYLGAGLYDCFIIEKPSTSPKFIVPYYRFTDATNAIDFDPYRVAYECIIPPGVTFQVKEVKFGLIKVCPLQKPEGTVEKLNDDTDNAKTYWRRIITIQPILDNPQTTPPVVAPLGSAGGKEKARKPRNKKLNEEFY